MNDTSISWHRRLYDRLRGLGGLTVGLVIGAAAFGATTAVAGPSDLTDPGGPQQDPQEECREGCDDEEINGEFWQGFGVYILEQIFDAPPSPPDRLATNS